MTGRSPAIGQVRHAAQVVMMPRPLLVHPVPGRGYGSMAQRARISGPRHAEERDTMAGRKGAVRKGRVRLRINARIVVIASDFQGMGRGKNGPPVPMARIAGRGARVPAGEVRSMAVRLVAGAGGKAVQRAVAIPALRQYRYRFDRMQRITDIFRNVLIGKIALEEEEERHQRNRHARYSIQGFAIKTVI